MGVCTVPGEVNLEISIVVPAFNESRRLGQSLSNICQFLEGTLLSFEVIVVDDGSTDDTADIVRRFHQHNTRLIQNDRNRGKGYTVRAGVLNARGRYVLFTDADLSAPIEELQKLYDVAERDQADIVIGSRAVDRRYIKRHQSKLREIGGIVFNRLARVLLGLDIHDTQCGFKLFHRHRTRMIFDRQTIDGFGFDPEVLFLAVRNGLHIREIPVSWSHADGTKVDFVRDGLRMLSDLLRIRWNYLTGEYADRIQVQGRDTVRRRVR